MHKKLARGQYSWCWLKGLWALEMRMSSLQKTKNTTITTVVTLHTYLPMLCHGIPHSNLTRVACSHKLAPNEKQSIYRNTQVKCSCNKFKTNIKIIVQYRKLHVIIYNSPISNFTTPWIWSVVVKLHKRILPSEREKKYDFPLTPESQIILSANKIHSDWQKSAQDITLLPICMSNSPDDTASILSPRELDVTLAFSAIFSTQCTR